MRGQDVIRQALGREIALLLGYPLLQSSMSVNDECGHASILLGRLRTHAAWADAGSSRIAPPVLRAGFRGRRPQPYGCGHPGANDLVLDAKSRIADGGPIDRG